MKDRTNIDAFDRWTPVHFAVGFAMGEIPLPAVVVLLAGYEVLEHQIEKNGSNVFNTTRPESERNVAVDLAAGFLGYALHRALKDGRRR